MSTIRIKNSVKSQNEDHAYLVQPQGGSCFEMTDFLSIGRDPTSGCFLSDPYVSSRHARIERQHGAYVLRDLQSKNGTFLNESKVSEAVLQDRDVIRVGQTELVFTYQLIENVRSLELTSKNEAYRQQLERLPQIAALDIPVLILGPSGTGKELLAQAVHNLSPRAKGPYVSVNCSALSESLVESELFGHLRGSFTGATHDRKGAFEAARGGTLFLDEIGDLPLSLQPKLLRALENQEIRPVGSDCAIKTDVRIVAATHQSLPDKVQKGDFRMDLYYRLHGVQILPPPLRLRLEDFEDLLFGFARQVKVRFSHSAIGALKQHSWPGNIRELKNVVSRAKALFGSQTVEAQHIETLIPPSLQPNDLVAPASPSVYSTQFRLKDWERDLILSRLDANKGNQRKTAEELGIPKSTLHDRLKAYEAQRRNDNLS